MSRFERDGIMLDRYDPRDDDRDRGSVWCGFRDFGSRGSTSERNRNDERDPRDVFTRGLELPRGLERRPVSGKEGYVAGEIALMQSVFRSAARRTSVGM